MNLFDKLVTEALTHQPNLSTLRMVVEKELLHHEILSVMQANNLLSNLTFIGGTCLRACYGSTRLSEDLDFTGGKTFSRENLSVMGHLLVKSLQDKYGLKVTMREPIEDKKNVDTWKLKIETRPEAKHIPAQRINIDICAVPSYESRPMILLNPYGVDMGTSGLIIQAQSREEIYTDKLIAFAFRPNRIKYRDLWDIMWLHSQGIKPKLALVSSKLKDRHCTIEYFLATFEARVVLLKEHPQMTAEFNQEMHRFLPVKLIQKTLKQSDLWNGIVVLMEDLGHLIRGHYSI